MSTPSTSYEALAFDLGVAHLTNSATWQALLGVSTDTAARARVVEGDGGIPADHDPADGDPQATAGDDSVFDLVPPFAVAAGEVEPPEPAGTGVFTRRGRVLFTIVLPRRLPGETPPAALRRARNVLGDIRQECEAAFGATGRLATGTAALEGPFLPDEIGSDRDALFGIITLTWHT